MEDTKPKSFLFAPDEATQEKLEELMKELNLDRTKATRHAIVWCNLFRKEANEYKEHYFRTLRELQNLKEKVKDYLQAKENLEKSI